MKERLIGAAVLVALGVWLIPWVLDGPAAPSESRSAALQLPVPEEPVPMRSQTIHLDEEHDPPGPAAPSAVADTDEAPLAPSGGSPAPVVARSTASADTRAHAPTAEPATPASPLVVAPAPQVIDKPGAASATAQAGWMVQLGSFSEEENARRLAQRVTTFGYKPDISNHRASGRTMYRVRVGPHDSRERAAAAASALSAHGFVAQVVAAD